MMEIRRLKDKGVSAGRSGLKQSYCVLRGASLRDGVFINEAQEQGDNDGSVCGDPV